MRLTRFVMTMCACITLMLWAPAHAATQSPAKTLYARQASQIFIDRSGHGAAIGNVTPGTALQISNAGDHGLQAFTLVGWSQQGDDTTLFTAPGQRIVLATLTNEKKPLKTLSASTDSYGNVWNKVELSGYIRPGQLTPNQDEVWEKAKAIYTKRCSACHALHHPDEFTANQWPKILQMMTKNAALQPNQAALVTQYIQSHAKSSEGDAK